MNIECEAIQENIGQSLAGEFDPEIHAHLKMCRNCDKYAQDILRLEQLFRKEALRTERSGERTWRKVKWTSMALAAILILILPEPSKNDLDISRSSFTKPTTLVATDFTETASMVMNEMYEELANMDLDLSDRKADIWDQLDGEEWSWDSFSESMEILREWQTNELELQKS